MSLIESLCDADAALETVLEPLAAVFGSTLERHQSGMVKATDGNGGSAAIAAELSGERERGCEIVTAPLSAPC